MTMLPIITLILSAIGNVLIEARPGSNHWTNPPTVTVTKPTTTTTTKKPASSSDDPGIIAQAGFPDNQPSIVWAVDPIGLPLPLPGGQPVASVNTNAFPMNVPIAMAPAPAGSVAAVNIGATQGSVDSSNSSSTASSTQSTHQQPTQRPVIRLLPVLPG